MTRKKSNVKALALAVTCAILTGGGIGLEPVYAADELTYDTSTNQLKNGATAIDTLTIGGVTIHGSGKSYGITIGDKSKYVMISDHDISATGSVSANIITSGINARMSDGNVIAKNGLYIGYDDFDPSKATYDNSKFAVKGSDGSFKAAGGKFIVDKYGNINKASSITTYVNTLSTIGGVKGNNIDTSGAITAASLKLNGMANDVKTTIETNASDIATNAANIATKADQTALNTANGKITALEGKADAVSKQTAGIQRISKVFDGTSKNGTSIENTLEVYENGTVTINENATNNPVTINSKGIKVGNNSAVVSEDGFKTSGDLYVGTKTNPTEDATDARFYVKGADGSIKAADGKFTVDDKGNVVSQGSVTANKAGFNDLAVTNGLTVGSATGDFVNMQNGNVVATGSVTAKGGLNVANGNFTVDGTTGDTIVKGKLDVTGAATLGSTLDVNGKATLKDELQVDKKATFGTVAGSQTVINDGDITADGSVTAKGGLSAADSKFTVNGTSGLVTFGDDAGNQSTIAGKTATFGTGTGDQTVIVGGAITANSLTVDSFGAATITANDTLKVGTNVSLNKDGDLVLGTNTLTNAQLGNINNTIKAGQVIEANSGEIGGVKFSTTGEISDVKNITAEKGTIGQVGLEGGKITANNGGTIAGVNFAAGGNVSNIASLTATGTIQGATLKVNDINYLDSEGLHTRKATIDKVVIQGESITTTGAAGLNVSGVNLKDGAITATSATIGGVNKLDNTGITVNDDKAISLGASKITNGKVEVSSKTSLANEALVLNDTNKWTREGGLVADKASINGVTIGETEGKAVFNKAAKATTIDGDKITTGTITADELNVDKISLGKGADKNITIGSNGDVTTKGDIKITDAAGNVMSTLSQDKATFGKDTANQTVIENGQLNAKAEDNNHQQAELKFDENGFAVNGQTAEGKTSAFGFNTKTGIGTFKGLDQTTTTINGSTITSTKATDDTGVLNGSNLTLTNGTNSTALTAGGATFTGANGRSNATGVKNQTTIDGGIITTDTLNVQRIELGDKLVDSNGTSLGGKLSMDEYGNIKAAGGKFTVAGTNQTNPGALHNEVGKTSFDTTETGASMKYNNGTVESNVSVGDNSAKISAGASSIEVKNDGITNNGKTTFTGAAGRSDATGLKNQTTIDGGIITTDTLNVQRIELGDKLVDKNGTAFGSNLSMDNQGNFSAAGGNFKVNGADGAMTNTVGKTSFATSDDGVNSSVTQDATHKSEFNQGLTSIGGVVTNGTVKMSQELTADGVKFEQTGYDEVNIAKGDVTVTNNRNTTDPRYANQTVNLSDLGSLNNLDGELEARDEYQNNKTAVGAINAEAGIRREEVARLDNRIDDVNNRVDKVGAMAAAIASLKSIGYDPQAPSEFSIGLGQYKGETGVAMGFFHYPNKNFMINVSLSTAGGETMGGIGATWRFGHKSPQKLLEEQREAQAKKELAAAEKYQAAAKLAKEAQERAEYAAKLARQAQVSADNAKAAADATQAKHFG